MSAWNISAVPAPTRITAKAAKEKRTTAGIGRGSTHSIWRDQAKAASEPREARPKTITYGASSGCPGSPSRVAT